MYKSKFLYSLLSSFWTICSNILPIFNFVELFPFYWVMNVLHVLCIPDFIGYGLCKCFLPVFDLSFYSPNTSFQRAVSKFDGIQCISFFFPPWIRLFPSYQRNLSLTNSSSQKFLLCFFWSFISVDFIFQTLGFL